MELTEHNFFGILEVQFGRFFMVEKMRRFDWSRQRLSGDLSVAVLAVRRASLSIKSLDVLKDGRLV